MSRQRVPAGAPSAWKTWEAKEAEASPHWRMCGRCRGCVLLRRPAHETGDVCSWEGCDRNLEWASDHFLK
eukprot:scaffold2065_cov114-Isochrysis_galbana.AAC.6